jgi:hypothetical protein
MIFIHREDAKSQRINRKGRTVLQVINYTDYIIFQQSTIKIDK